MATRSNGYAMRSLLTESTHRAQPPRAGKSLLPRCARLFGVAISKGGAIAASGGVPPRLVMARRRGHVLSAIFCTIFLSLGSVHAQTIKMLVQSSPLAGFQYHAGASVWNELKVGDALTLVREADNPHDANAVRVEWRGHMLGYLPRAENRAVAAEMDRGTIVSGRIAQLREDRNPWLRVLVEVFVVL